VRREGPRTGAVLARVASSHLRVGTFEFVAARGNLADLRRLADFAIERHDPDLAGDPERYLRFLERVCERQSRLVAQWMSVGFAGPLRLGQPTGHPGLEPGTVGGDPAAVDRSQRQSTRRGQGQRVDRQRAGTLPAGLAGGDAAQTRADLSR